MASIRNKDNKHECTGIAVHPFFVLTAVTCILLIYGDKTKSSVLINNETHYIENLYHDRYIKRYCEFSKSILNKKDIGLIKVSSTKTF